MIKFRVEVLISRNVRSRLMEKSIAARVVCPLQGLYLSNPFITFNIKRLPLQYSPRELVEESPRVLFIFARISIHSLADALVSGRCNAKRPIFICLPSESDVRQRREECTAPRTCCRKVIHNSERAVKIVVSEMRAKFCEQNAISSGINTTKSRRVSA